MDGFVQKELKVINITETASADGLREKLSAEATSRGHRITSLVVSIYNYAYDNQALFQTPLKSPGKKPGDHIGARVKDSVAEGLQAWAKSTNRSRGYLCCYILEKAIEDDMIEDVIKAYKPE